MASPELGSSSPPSSPLAQPTITFDNRPFKLHHINKSPIHRLTLADWTKQLSDSNAKLVRKLNSRSTSLANLYQILGFFFVFQGVIISAAVQASDKKVCHNVWILGVLSLIASVATFFACKQKLTEFEEADRSCYEEKGLCSALATSIQALKVQGPAFDVAKGQPTIKQSRHLQSPAGHGFVGGCKKWVVSHSGAVYMVVLAIALTTPVAVFFFLCHHG